MLARALEAPGLGASFQTSPPGRFHPVWKVRGSRELPLCGLPGLPRGRRPPANEHPCCGSTFASLRTCSCLRRVFLPSFRTPPWRRSGARHGGALASPAVGCVCVRRVSRPAKCTSRRRRRHHHPDAARRTCSAHQSEASPASLLRRLASSEGRRCCCFGPSAAVILIKLPASDRGLSPLRHLRTLAALDMPASVQQPVLLLVYAAARCRSTVPTQKRAGRSRRCACKGGAAMHDVQIPLVVTC